jgi:hypothetical protein
MEVLYPHCVGLDVHKDTVVACVRHMANGEVRREVRTFKTTTKGRDIRAILTSRSTTCRRSKR